MLFFTFDTDTLHLQHFNYKKRGVVTLKPCIFSALHNFKLKMKSEPINKTRAWDREKIQVLTEIEPMTSRTHKWELSTELQKLIESNCSSSVKGILHTARISTVKVIRSVTNE